MQSAQLSALRIDVPRDREGEFEPKLIGKHERRFTGFNDKIIAMYARGMTVREIQGFVAEMYATDVTPCSPTGSGTRAVARPPSGAPSFIGRSR
jgi:transposase-like protein